MLNKKNYTKNGILATQVLNRLENDVPDWVLEAASETKPSRINTRRQKEDHHHKKKKNKDSWN